MNEAVHLWAAFVIVAGEEQRLGPKVSSHSDDEARATIRRYLDECCAAPGGKAILVCGEAVRQVDALGARSLWDGAGRPIRLVE